jgi:hypothetical protein
VNSKKLIGIILKTLIGVASFALIYWRIKNDFTTENIQILKESLFSFKSVFCIVLSILLFPVNWAIESYKWMLITNQTEKISFKTAMKSVYAGVCIGNLAPGRATEFLAKIHFFKPENKLTITVLHFVGGMFQLSITIFCGMLALFLRSYLSENVYSLMNVISISISAVVMLVFVLILFNINRFVSWLYQRFNRENYEEVKAIIWSKKLIFQLFSFSILRYMVFSFQFILLLYVFHLNVNYLHLLISIYIYFLFTTIIPMFSVIEAAVRTAIALIVFSDFGLSNSALAIVAILLWLINIVFPSIIGYLILLKENLNFSSFSLKKQKEI